MLRCEWLWGCELNKRILKRNIKKTLFFSYSVIFSTLFFLIYLVLKTECWNIDREIKDLERSKYKYSSNIKSLKRKKNLLIRSVEDVALVDYRFVIPDPQPFVVLMDDE